MRFHRTLLLCAPLALLYFLASTAHAQVLISLSTTSNSLLGGGSANLTALVTGATNKAVTWSASPTVEGASLGTGSPADPGGLSTNTYKAPPVIASRQTVTITATSVADPTQSAVVQILLTPSITVSVTASPTSTPAPGQTITLQAVVQGTSQSAVDWSASGTVGTFSSSGNTATFVAPNPIVSSTSIKITAALHSDNTFNGSATLTLNAVSVSISPTSASVSGGAQQQFTATLSNAPKGLTWSLSPALGTIDNNTGIYTAPAAGSFTNGTKVTVTATSIDDATKSATATVTLTAVAVTVTPSSVSLGILGQQQFTATVSGSTNGAVTWSISPVLGSIDNSGFYTAPPTVTGTQRVTVTATSVADTSKTGTATVTITPTAITISPTTVTLTSGQTQQFTATVSGATLTTVTWSINPQIGTIDQTGFYTAPSTVSGTTKVTVTATSQNDATKSANATVTLNTSIEIGSGAPTQALAQQFFSAFYRNGFSTLAGLPPLGLVKPLGSTAGYYVQEFPDFAKTAGVRYALASASATVSAPASDGTITSVFQIYGPEYAYYLAIGPGTAGYPLSDTNTCPSFDPSNSCMYQLFDKSYALFVYSNALASGATTFFVRQGIYTEWLALGGAAGIGRPITSETAVTATKIAPATAGSTATAQTFSGGAIYSITSGTSRGQVHGVTEPIYDMYVAAGGPTGALGLPTSEVLVFSSGLHKQTFEGGVLQYTPGGGGGTVLPVTAVSLTGATAGSTINLNLGQTLTLTATPTDAAGDQLTDRPISWSSSNGQVITVTPQPNSQSAVLTAVGGGTAAVTASSGGITSGKVTVVVTSPCCQVGDGAPLAVQLAFQNALTRNSVAVQTPVPSPASRAGTGYIQMVQSGGTSPSAYLLAQSDRSGSAYLVSGVLLAAYQSLGGPTGTLGYPISDASAGGTQRFENGALGGNPVRLVTGGILAKWALLGYEAGAAGAPVSDPAAFSTFGANAGVSQNFSGGTIYSATSGPRAGATYFVTGLILSTYNATGGAGGNLGMPVGDEFATGSVHQQDFEGGNVTYTAGAASAQVQFAPKVPVVIVAPSSISAGARARLAISGFPNSSPIKVSVTGQPDFVVSPANGAYRWDIFIPLSAASGSLTINAADTKSAASASGILTIKGFDSNRVQMTAVRGDKQSGAPGALLPVPFQVALLDSSGDPVVGAPVTFQASSPGAQLSTTSTVTDAAGQASTYLRLPATAGVTGVTAQSAFAQSAVTFYAMSAAAGITNFPAVQQTGSAALGSGTATIAQKGALISAVAAILRYKQNSNAVPSPNGLADAPTLNQFLTTYCGVDASGNKVCDGFLSNPDSGEQIVNLWRAAQFTGGLDVTVIPSTVAAIDDLVSQGEPVLLSLGLSLNGASAGGHFVVATGVAADGSIVIQDPSPLFARSNLGDYLNGFQAAGGTWTGSILGAVRFATQTPSTTRFLLGALSQPAAVMSKLAFDVSSSSGACGAPLQMLDMVDASGHAPAAGPLVSKVQVCDGLLSSYQLSVGTGQPYHAFVTDLASGGGTIDLSGSAPAIYQASRPQLNLKLTPQSANFTAAGVVNAATFTAAIAPGGIVSIFGSGLASSAAATTVDIDGEALSVLSSSPFQINAVLPGDVTPGAHALRVTSPFGTVQQQVTVSALAPAIFLVGNPPVGAVENQNGSLNGPANPGARGEVLVVFATGLGAVMKRGQLSSTNATVTAVVNGVELPVNFAGLTPQFAGLYQVNVPIPANSAPGSGISLTLKEGGVLSNTVTVAVQ